jgi:hypothetical protein
LVRVRCVFVCMRVCGCVYCRYLFYLKRIGIAVSPLSNNLLFLDYNRNPFYKVSESVSECA